MPQASIETAGDADTRARILDAAIVCFTEFGNEKTSLNDVARVAGLARQTIYRYFPDRRSLLEAVQGHEDARLRDEVTALAARSSSLETFLAELVAARVAAGGRYRTREHLLALDRGLVQSLFLSRDHRQRLVRELVTPELERARRRGELRPGVAVDEAAEWIAITLGGLSTLTAATTFDVDDPVAVGLFYARHICHGLVAESTDRRRGGRSTRAGRP
jgi:AcrR family transcriptional regulator